MFSAPFSWICGLLGGTSAHVQVCVRMVLAVATWTSFVFLAHCLFPKTSRLRVFFYIVCSVQFHLLFWSSRTTPNGLVFPFVTASLGAIIHGRHAYVGLVALASLAIILRLELVCLAIPSYLWVWLHQRRRFFVLFLLGMVSCLCSVAVSMMLDSYFWKQRMLWPEGYALFFNVIQGHSADWGTSPPWAYLVQDLPRVLGGALPLALVGCARRRASTRTSLLVHIVVHVGLMSALAHKEWRFVMYVVPLCNALAALGLEALWKKRIGIFLSMTLLCMSAAFCALATWISMSNYPGGEALVRFHRHIGNWSQSQSQGQVVHIEPLAAMTGVSLFQSTHLARPHGSFVPSALPAWIYDKNEHVSDDCAWTYTLSEHACDGLIYVQEGEPVYAYNGLKIQGPRAYAMQLSHILVGKVAVQNIKSVLPFDLMYTPQLWICKRVVPCDAG